MLADLGEGVVDDFLRNTGSLIWRSGSHLKLQGTAGTLFPKTPSKNAKNGCLSGYNVYQIP